MRTQGEHIRTLRRRVDFLKAREHRNSYDSAELGALEWALVNLPPAQQEPVDFSSLLREAEEIVQKKPIWKRFIDGTPLSNDIAVWMTVFAQDVARRTSPPAQQEPVTWGVDWGKAGDIPCVSIIKRLPGGGIEVVAVEYAPYTFKEKNL